MPKRFPLFPLAQAAHFRIGGSLAEGLQALLKSRIEGSYQVLSVWSPVEILQQPARDRVKLYYFPADAKKPFALVCPGGAYASVARVREGFPTAAALNQAGHPAFVLVYRTGLAARHPAPLEDVAQAIRLIMAQAGKLGLENLRYSVWGYSAGGHLVLSWGTSHLGAPAWQLPKPTAIVAAYPVVNMGEHAHALSRGLLLGRNPSDETIVAHSIEQQITPDYPPTYVWHCTADPVVSITNSDRLVEALDQAGVPCQYKVVPGVAHGWGIGHGTAAEGWFEEALEFWHKRDGVLN
ncbi:MAG: alpha/beta hydrolase [Clostridia bacterium]|nr:alpha/beta hydrolase [Clostridia bacterium]NCC75497.1 alpha/beta hydrolase [Clostridia bacterium]